MHTFTNDVFKSPQRLAQSVLQAAEMLGMYKAELFIHFYQSLYSAMDGAEAAMCHWLHADNPELGGIPLILMVDCGKLSYIMDFLQGTPKLKR